MQRRICYFLRLPADGIDDDDDIPSLPERPTLEQLDNIERRYEERNKKEKRKFDAIREVIALKEKAERLRREAEEIED